MLNIYIGAMYSGKTTELMNNYCRYKKYNQLIIDYDTNDYDMNNDSINNVIMVGTGSGASGGDSLYLNYQAVLNPELNHDKYQIIKLVLDTTILANQG